VAIEEYSGRPPMSYESALCGSVGGAIGAALTTPLDVLKTRIMLSSSKVNFVSTITGCLEFCIAVTDPFL
jgi:uncharacterized membrane protein